MMAKNTFKKLTGTVAALLMVATLGVQAFAAPLRATQLVIPDTMPNQAQIVYKDGTTLTFDYGAKKDTLSTYETIWQGDIVSIQVGETLYPISNFTFGSSKNGVVSIVYNDLVPTMRGFIQ